MKPIKLLVDGVFFQLNNTGIARLWKSVLEILSLNKELEIYFLDRGNSPLIQNVRYIPFPVYYAANCPADSFLIQEVCNEFNIDIFTSTYYTTPINTPMVLVLYDMIPELFNFDMSHRIWMEKVVSINYAQFYICISENTRRDLLKCYPYVPPERTAVAHCGVDHSVFKPRSNEEITRFRSKYGLKKPYFLLVGSRVQEKGYKNSGLFFNSLKKLSYSDYDILCVGGEPHIEQDILSKIPEGVRCIRLDLDDYELSVAYSGAIALIYPSLYEGFGMPVIEAMACGCPVITTKRGSLIEAAGDAAFFIDGTNLEEMIYALEQIRNDSIRTELIEKGLMHSKKFTWDVMANEILKAVKIVLMEANQGMYDSFFKKWYELRKIQLDVDYAKK